MTAGHRDWIDSLIHRVTLHGAKNGLELFERLEGFLDKLEAQAAYEPESMAECAKKLLEAIDRYFDRQGFPRHLWRFSIPD